MCLLQYAVWHFLRRHRKWRVCDQVQSILCLTSETGRGDHTDCRGQPVLHPDPHQERGCPGAQPPVHFHAVCRDPTSPMVQPHCQAHGDCHTSWWRLVTCVELDTASVSAIPAHSSPHSGLHLVIHSLTSHAPSSPSSHLTSLHLTSCPHFILTQLTSF